MNNRHVTDDRPNTHNTSMNVHTDLEIHNVPTQAIVQQVGEYIVMLSSTDISHRTRLSKWGICTNTSY